MFSDDVYTVEDVSLHLRVPEDAVREEIAAGRLHARNFAGHIRILGSDFNAYLGASLEKPDATVSASAKSQGEPNKRGAFQLSPAPAFNYNWPARKGQDKSPEEYTDVVEGIASYRGKEHLVRVGFTHRESVGKNRRRSLVLVDRYATVEFVAADAEKNGRMAAIIRDRNGKQIPVGATVPIEYQSLPVSPYSDIVVGPGASNGLAVVCESTDIDTMVRHALIRYSYREERA